MFLGERLITLQELRSKVQLAMASALTTTTGGFALNLK